MYRILFYMFEYAGIFILKIRWLRLSSWCFGKATKFGVLAGIYIPNPARYKPGEPLLILKENDKNVKP